MSFRCMEWSRFRKQKMVPPGFEPGSHFRITFSPHPRLDVLFSNRRTADLISWTVTPPCRAPCFWFTLQRHFSVRRFVLNYSNVVFGSVEYICWHFFFIDFNSIVACCISQIYHARDNVVRVHHLLAERGRRRSARLSVLSVKLQNWCLCDMAAK